MLVVMLTYGPAMRVAAMVRRHPAPDLPAQRAAGCRDTTDWDMSDLTYNQGIHGAQDTANAMVRSGRPFHVITDDWRLPAFEHADGRGRGPQQPLPGGAGSRSRFSGIQ